MAEDAVAVCPPSGGFSSSALQPVVPSPDSEDPKAGYRSRVWLATLNNYVDADLQRLRGLGADIGRGTNPSVAHLKYMCFTEEIGAGGTPHLHLYWVFDEPKRVSFLQHTFGNKRLGGCVVPRGSPEQILAYYSKECAPEEFGANPWPFDVPHAGKREEQAVHGAKGGAAEKKRWADARELLKAGKVLELDPQIMICHWTAVNKIAKHYEDARPMAHKEGIRGVWIYGAPGTGKSHWAREQALLACEDDHKMVYYKDMSHRWWDGYTNQSVVIGDDFDKYHKALGFHLKIWLDKYSFNAELKGGSVRPVHNVFFITSNYSIEECFDDEVTQAAVRRRCKVIHFGGYREICEKAGCSCRAPVKVACVPIQWKDGEE